MKPANEHPAGPLGAPGGSGTNRDGAGRHSRQRGATAVEVAIVAPLLGLLFVGIINVGLLVWEHQVIQNAAREGARFAALPVNCVPCSANQAQTLNNIKQFVVGYALQQNVTLDPSTITVNWAYPIPSGGDVLLGTQIVITYPRSALLTGASGLLGFSQATLSAQAVFRNLYG